MNNQGFNFADLKNESIIDADSLVIETLTLPNLDPNSVAIIDINNNLSDVVLTNGQLLIGSTNAPVANNLNGTTDEVIVTNGSGYNYIINPTTNCYNIISNICKSYIKWKFRYD